MSKNYVDKIIKVAREEVGYLEKKTNAYLNYKKKNAGYNNYTKYGKWYGMNGVAWCCIFVSWLMRMAFGEKEGKKLLLGSWYSYCPTIMNAFKAKGQFHTSPKVGDLILFKTSDGAICGHIGFVYKISNGYVYTIEGNTSAEAGVVPNGGGVAYKSYAKNYPSIVGYCRPKYDKKPEKLTAPEPTLRRNASGAAVKKLQKCLNKIIKANLAVDGDYGKKTSDAVKSYKVTYKIASDDGDVYGKTMYKSLKKQLKKLQ